MAEEIVELRVTGLQIIEAWRKFANQLVEQVVCCDGREIYLIGQTCKNLIVKVNYHQGINPERIYDRFVVASSECFMVGIRGGYAIVNDACDDKEGAAEEAKKLAKLLYGELVDKAQKNDGSGRVNTDNLRTMAEDLSNLVGNRKILEEWLSFLTSAADELDWRRRR